MADNKVAGLTLGVDVSQVNAATKSLKEFKQANAESARSVEDLAMAESIATAKAKQFRKEQQDTAKAAGQLATEFNGALGTIDPLTAKMNKLAAASKVLDRAWAAGIVPDDEFFRLGEVLDQTNTKLLKSRSLMTEEGQAAAQLEKDTSRLAATQQKFLQGLEGQVNAMGKTAAEMAALRAAQLGVSEQAAPLVQKMTQQAQAMKDAADAAKNKAAADRAAAAAEASSNANKARFIKALQDEADALGKSRQELLEFKAAQLGVSAQAAPLIAKLTTQTNQLKLAGVSAGQYSQAMRMLPAQITDVVTSLASGMPVWMVAIQQGGQIKDSFGGIGNTFKVLLGYLTPLRLAMGGIATIVTAMGVAAYDAYKRQSQLNQALILSGNYAGATVKQFNDMTDSISASSNATRGMIDDIATSLASSGKYTLTQIKTITKATADWATATGQDSGKIVGYFDQIAKDPVKGLKDLNDQFNFLDKGFLTHIKNLKDTQGETAAVTAASEKFAEVMEERVAKIADSSTPLEKMWTDVKKWASDAWTTVGERTLGALNLITDVVAGTVEQIRYLINQGDIMLGEFVQSAAQKLSNIPGTGTFFSDIADQQGEVIKQAKANNEELIKSINERNERIKKGELGYVQMAKDSQDAASQYSTKTKAAVDAEYAAIQKKNKAQKTSIDQGQKIQDQYQMDILALQSQLKVLQDHQQIDEKISQQQKTYWNDVAKFQVLEQKQANGTITAKEKQLLAEKDIILQYSQQKADIGNMIVQQERLNKLKDDSTKYVNQMTAQTQALVSAQGLSTKEQERQNELAKLRSTWMNNGGSADDLGLKQQEDALKKFYAAQDAQTQNWQAGASKAFKDWGDSVNDVYTNIQGIATSALDGLSTQLSTFLTTGKASFKDFASSIISDIVSMITKMMVFNAVSGGLGLLGFSGGGQVGNASYAVGGYTGAGGKYEPAGVVHKGEFVFTKEATKRIGTANLYRMMRGYANGGAVGSAQSSTSGVISSGSGGVQFNNMNVNIGSTVDSGADAKSMENGIKQIVQDMMTKATQQGGVIYNYIKAKKG